MVNSIFIVVGEFKDGGCVCFSAHTNPKRAVERCKQLEKQHKENENMRIVTREALFEWDEEDE